MLIRHTLLAAAVFTAVLAGCNKQRDEAPAAPPPAGSSAAPASPADSGSSSATPAAPAAVPPADSSSPAPASGDSGEKK
ncbi:hypothetical protein [Herbaspirillum sp.]|uniref:hypothetical protein n=1 Tax=Herbaspirillum sp. TaxID=1890675 RepID=UPI001B2327E0|nr:hypothetical protein [Herbaspirillum sp.]MBO9538540.1 hypothetical protein [Herbaspirillum sp.]